MATDRVRPTFVRATVVLPSQTVGRAHRVALVTPIAFPIVHLGTAMDMDLAAPTSARVTRDMLASIALRAQRVTEATQTASSRAAGFSRIRALPEVKHGLLQEAAMQISTALEWKTRSLRRIVEEALLQRYGTTTTFSAVHGPYQAPFLPT